MTSLLRQVVFICFICFSSNVLAQEDTMWTWMPPKGYIAYRAVGEMVIDGKADEADWLAAFWTDDFIDIQGDHMPKPRFRTRVKMLWDDDYCYFFCQMDEPHVWGDITDRDAVIFYNNDFEIFMKPYSYAPQYGELEVNCLNTVWDLLLMDAYREGGPVVYNWDIKGLQSAVHIDGTVNDPSDTDQGWSVEIAIPWSAMRELKFNRKPEETPAPWRINFSRVQWQHEIVDGKYQKKKNDKGKLISEDNWVWSPQGAINMHQPETWGIVQFSRKATGTDTLVREENEGIILALYHLYRKQKGYFKKHGEYQWNLYELAPELMGGDDPLFASMNATFHGYEIILYGLENGIETRFVINEKGRIKKVKE